MKVPDPKRNQGGKIDIDLFMSYEIEEYQNILKHIRENVGEIFRAADVLITYLYIYIYIFIYIYK